VQAEEEVSDSSTINFKWDEDGPVSMDSEATYWSDHPPRYWMTRWEWNRHHSITMREIGIKMNASFSPGFNIDRLIDYISTQAFVEDNPPPFKGCDD
jgi:hypothetical protein